MKYVCTHVYVWVYTNNIVITWFCNFESFADSSIIAQFNEAEYEFDIDIYSPVGTLVFEALFIINPNVIIEFLSFDIITTDELEEETNVDRDFMINGTSPPIVVRPPYQSMYLLAITTGNVIDTSDTTDITFNLFAFVKISTGVVKMLISNVTLHKIGRVHGNLVSNHVYDWSFSQIVNTCFN